MAVPVKEELEKKEQQEQAEEQQEQEQEQQEQQEQHVAMRPFADKCTGIRSRLTLDRPPCGTN